MKKINAISALAMAIVFGGVSLAEAQVQNPAQGGFSGPSIVPVSVKQALDSWDDTAVIMVGKIDKGLGDEKYSFSDETGTIVVEIDDEDWRGLVVSPNDIIEIHGEVDKDFMRTEIDVNRVIKK